MANYDYDRMKEMARQIRRDTLRMIVGAGSGHPGGALGAAEVFAALYGGVMNADPKRPDDLSRDRLVLSNGHICAAWYSALSLTGFLPRGELATFRRLGSRLQGHPSRQWLPGLVETSSGPLGQSFSVANGIALGLRMQGSKGRVYCLVGDGEMQEGIVWEAMMSAAQYGLSNLTLVVLFNNLQIDGEVAAIKNLSPLKPRLESFGWEAYDVYGHDLAALTWAFEMAAASKGKPAAVIANTLMGRGVTFMENLSAWHGNCPSREQVAQGLAQLGDARGFRDYPDARSGL